MKQIVFFLTALLPVTEIAAQSAADTATRQLHEIVVEAYLRKQTLLQVPTSTSVISNRQFQLQPGITLLPAMNTVPGVRMEERSPGSYRLSVRGSLLRSPFGIRNVKIYMDEMPLTDAGGNTYLNLADPGSIQSAEILKGPDGSLFGANSGGVIRLQPFPPATDSNHLHAGIQGGSYGLFHEKAGWQQQWGPYRLQLYQAYQRADGYRQNSALKRYYMQTAQQWQYNARNQLKLLAFYSDLSYRTPGGLTEAQAKHNPRAARPATATLPGAVEQKAGIYNRTFQGGLVHEANISPAWRHVITVFGANTHFENPFITNYEARDENTAGLRTYLSLHDQPITGTGLRLNWNTGLEWQGTTSDIINYGNRGGVRDTVQAADKLKAQQHFYFTSLSVRLHERWIWEAAVSLNYYRYTFNEPSKGDSTRKFSPQLMPRFSLSYLITPALAARLTLSRGYSPPAIAEVRASDNIINTALQAETGWNHEAGLRLSGRRNRYWLDASVYYYRMQDAIVRQLRDDGTEYFTNAGGTNQAGVEAQGMLWILAPRRHGIMQGLQWQSSYTYSHFRFRDYNSAGADHSGNNLTGVPGHVLVNSLLVRLPAGVYLFGQHNFTSRIPLNDANTAYASAYHLVQCKAGWEVPHRGKCRVAVFVGSDNVLNQYYSLGNDLNAFGQRFYNPAPGRNYFGGVSLML
ncbi:TonB-dependent receptor [Chitinophaga japonensis]|uniref:Iron complex outermembrane receptor protein n=1 Tax=Chitinophaga japonensis TaxID=104662 RepID=A0A562T3Z7_CHIJA|nr:TonB-dependent receptor [Chitinophaga japonensis]TWI87964.1 iron complex outermembrane receptor protein [Chitinophaga japonensis]